MYISLKGHKIGSPIYVPQGATVSEHLHYVLVYLVRDVYWGGGMWQWLGDTLRKPVNSIKYNDCQGWLFF